MRLDLETMASYLHHSRARELVSSSTPPLNIRRLARSLSLRNNDVTTLFNDPKLTGFSFEVQPSPHAAPRALIGEGGRSRSLALYAQRR